MRVNSSNSVSSSSTSKSARKRKSGSVFSPGEEESKQTPSNVSQSAPLSDIDALLALQSVDVIDPREKKKKAVVHGQAMLDELDKLKVVILSGGDMARALAALKRLLQQRPEYSEDPALSDLLDQINLRAEVELAKLNYK